MKVLIVGGGGREHTLAWKISQRPEVSELFSAPGNPGMRDTTLVDLSGLTELATFAERNAIDLTVVGPEAPLCAGITDLFRARGLSVFGPTADAARLEGSKSFAKDFMNSHGIPTADGAAFTDPQEARCYVRSVGAPVVVKADGLAAGKGVIVAQTEEEAAEAIASCFAGRFGDAGRKVLVEECLVGEEASILALTDGQTIVPLASSQDHKRIGDGDTGPNTGGMGAYSPAPVVTDELWARIRTEVLDRFLAGCQAQQLDYRGVIYAGVMVTEAGPKVLEFNVRFGDPETQAVLVRLESDLVEAMQATVEGRLNEITLRWTPQPAVCVVLASGGYPGEYAKGNVIHGLDAAEAAGAIVFHAGTKLEDDSFVTAGGRVLGVTAKGNSIREAVANTYQAVDCIQWENMYCRRDIAHRAFNR